MPDMSLRDTLDQWAAIRLRANEHFNVNSSQLLKCRPFCRLPECMLQMICMVPGCSRPLRGKYFYPQTFRPT